MRLSRALGIAIVLLLSVGCAGRPVVTEPSPPKTGCAEHLCMPLEIWKAMGMDQMAKQIETAYCLIGSRRGDVVTVWNAYYPPQKGEPLSIEYFCNPLEALGTAHTHVNGYCGFSPVDAESFKWPWIQADIIACGPDRFVYRVRGVKGNFVAVLRDSVIISARQE